VGSCWPSSAWKTIGRHNGQSPTAQQFHLDLGVENLDQAQEEVLKRGATLLDDGGGKRSSRIFADPAGHPFCLVRVWRSSPLNQKGDSHGAAVPFPFPDQADRRASIRCAPAPALLSTNPQLNTTGKLPAY
jgi:hypothetical protein